MGQKIEARFTCGAIIPQIGNKAIHFHAVYDNNGANASFSKATPYGTLIIGVDNETLAAEYFERGKNYKVTIEEVAIGE